MAMAQVDNIIEIDEMCIRDSHGAMLIEPTETESKQELDRFIHAMRLLAEAAKAGDVERFKGAPFHAPLRRLDETRAARAPRLRWTAPEGSNIAAE